jgi:hypothetical protein
VVYERDCLFWNADCADFGITQMVGDEIGFAGGLLRCL